MINAQLKQKYTQFNVDGESTLKVERKYMKRNTSHRTRNSVYSSINLKNVYGRIILKNQEA